MGLWWDAVDWRTIEDNVRRLQAYLEGGAVKEMEQGKSLATSSYAFGQRQVTCRPPVEADLANGPHLLIKQIGALRRT